MANEFNRPVYALNAFPVAEESRFKGGGVTIDDKNIILSTMKQSCDRGYVFRLFNGSEYDKQCTLYVGETKIALSFSVTKSKR